MRWFLLAALSAIVATLYLVLEKPFDTKPARTIPDDPRITVDPIGTLMSPTTFNLHLIFRDGRGSLYCAGARDESGGPPMVNCRLDMK